MRLVLSCEHGGQRVPARYRKLFAGAEAVLATHRGWDPGALTLARQMARSFGAPLVASTTTRLLVDLNRTRAHRALFSEWSKRLPPQERERLIERYWRAHRDALLEQLSAAGRVQILHLSVHSFTPCWKGRERTVDVGILHDPARAAERELASAWSAALRARDASLRVWRNRPYRGTSDGLTSELRARFSGRRYLGFELELSQRFPLGEPQRWSRLRRDVIGSLRQVLQ